MVDKTRIEELESLCHSIEEIGSTVDHYVTRTEWGEISFKSIKSEMDFVFWIVGQIKELNKEIIPDNVAQTLINHLSRFQTIFSEIDQFKISVGDASSTSAGISQNFRNEFEGFFSNLSSWLPLLALRAGDIENWTAKVKEASTESNNLLEESRISIENKFAEIELIVQAARTAAGQAGAAEFTQEFFEFSNSAEKRGKRWLWPTCAFAGVALYLSVSIVFGWFIEIPENTIDAIYRFGGRILAISVLFYAAVWSGRIVLANFNLASINKHRAISLQTLQAFRQSVEDIAARDAVAMEAARAVYENVPSGFIGNQGTGQNQTRLLEIIKNATQSDNS